MKTCLSDRVPVTLTAREAETVRTCIERIRRLGLRDRRLTNLTDRMSVTVKRAARRSGKAAAAEFVHKFRSDKYGRFHLPTLLAAMELQDQKNDIDELAETIEGADLLRDFTSGVWSCSRYGESSGWVADGWYCGFASYNTLYCSNLSVPLVLY